MTDPKKYDGPYEDQDTEDAAYKKWQRLREREKADDKAAAAAAAEEEKKKKGKGGLPVVD